MFNVRLNEAIDYGCNWNDGYVPYSDLENVVHCEASSPAAIYCFGPLKTEFISSFINRTVIDITQLGCPPIADINLSTISCTFACHNNSKHVCALRTAYSVAQCLHFYTILQYVSCPAQPAYHWYFPDVGILVTSTYLQPQRKGNKESFPLLGRWPETLRKNEALSGRTLLKDTQWFIPVTFKYNIPKGEVHELSDSCHTLSIHCGRYVRIMNENIQVPLSKTFGRI